MLAAEPSVKHSSSSVGFILLRGSCRCTASICFMYVSNGPILMDLESESQRHVCPARYLSFTPLTLDQFGIRFLTTPSSSQALLLGLELREIIDYYIRAYKYVRNTSSPTADMVGHRTESKANGFTVMRASTTEIGCPIVYHSAVRACIERKFGIHCVCAKPMAHCAAHGMVCTFRICCMHISFHSTPCALR